MRAYFLSRLRVINVCFLRTATAEARFVFLCAHRLRGSPSWPRLSLLGMKTPVQVTASLRASAGSVYKPPPPWMQDRYRGQGGHDGPSGHGDYEGHGGYGDRAIEGSDTVTSLTGEVSQEFYRSNTNGARSGVPRQAHAHKQGNGRMKYECSRSAQILATRGNLVQGAAERLRLHAKHLRSSCSVVVIFAIVLMPFIVALLVSDHNYRGRHSIEKDVRSALMDVVMANGTDDRWAEHIVLTQEGGSASVDIPATFHSRLNSELAPLMRQHATEIWGKSETPELKCNPPEKQIVSFSMAKSSRLPAECMLEENNKTQSIRDIRDLRVTFPTKSSRHMMRVQIAEDRQGPANAEDSLRRYSSWGRFRGRIFIDLSDTSKLAMQRYCGESDADVDIEPLAASDVLLITVLELKRLHGLWTSGSSARSSNPNDPNFDSIFRAVIAPLDLSPAHSSPIHALREGLRSKMWAVANQKPDLPGEHLRDSIRIESEPLAPATDSKLLPSEIERTSASLRTESSTNGIQTSEEGSLNENEVGDEDGGGDNEDTGEGSAQQMKEDSTLSSQSDVHRELRGDPNIIKSDLEPGRDTKAERHLSSPSAAVEEHVGERQSTFAFDRVAGKPLDVRYDSPSASYPTPSDAGARDEKVKPRFASRDQVNREGDQHEMPMENSTPSKLIGAENQAAAEDGASSFELAARRPDMTFSSLASPVQIPSDASVMNQRIPPRTASSDPQLSTLRQNEAPAKMPSDVSSRGLRAPQRPDSLYPQRLAPGMY